MHQTNGVKVARAALALSVLVLVVAGACGQRGTAVLGTQVSGCTEALRERAAAIAAIAAAEERALERDRARAAELQAVASEAKGAIVAAADLAPCEDPGGTRGVAADVGDLRARYRVIVDRAVAQLDQTAAQPAPAPGNNRGKGKGKD